MIKTSFKEELEVKFAVQKFQMPPDLPDFLFFYWSFSLFSQSLFIFWLLPCYSEWKIAVAVNYDPSLEPDN